MWIETVRRSARALSLSFVIAVLGHVSPALAAELTTPAAEPKAPAEERFSVHYQAVAATQAHPAFSASYSGQNSLSSVAEAATAMVMSLALDLRLWHGAD